MGRVARRYLTPLTAAGLAGRIYGNYKRKRKARKLKEQYPQRGPGRAFGGSVPHNKRGHAIRKHPTGPSSKVSAKYAVAPVMTKFKAVKKVADQKVPKTCSAHYKDYGLLSANRTIYVNHEHWSSADRFWYSIGAGLAKTILGKAKLYCNKSMDDPLIGPRTNPANIDSMITGDDISLSDTTYLQLVFATEGDEGVVTYDTEDVLLVDVSVSPDQYRTFKYVAQEISNKLQNQYFGQNKTWLCAAQFRTRGSGAGNTMTESNMSATPVTIMNLDDAEINCYVKSLIKFQNVTPADNSTAATGFDKGAIDANPLEGRLYTARGQHPIIDTDLLASGDRSLDKYFGDTAANGFTLCGHANNHTGADVGRIAHLPTAKRLYGNQTVESGTIHMGAGEMKYHSTYFTMKRTFRTLADVCSQQQGSPIDESNLMKDNFNKHTLFGFTIQHKHDEDTIKIGYNRETDVSCYVTHKSVKFPLKQNFTYNDGVLTTTVVPSEVEL